MQQYFFPVFCAPATHAAAGSVAVLRVHGVRANMCQRCGGRRTVLPCPVHVYVCVCVCVCGCEAVTVPVAVSSMRMYAGWAGRHAVLGP